MAEWVALFNRPSDEEAYREWLDGHPHGFVLNANTNPTPKYLKLHHVSCGDIVRYRNQNPTKDYMKACADSVEVIDAWARDHPRLQSRAEPPDRCAKCW